jgi:hypothetical protein
LTATPGIPWALLDFILVGITCPSRFCKPQRDPRLDPNKRAKLFSDFDAFSFLMRKTLIQKQKMSARKQAASDRGRLRPDAAWLKNHLYRVRTPAGRALSLPEGIRDRRLKPNLL